jgi:hypothetical protein
MMNASWLTASTPRCILRRAPSRALVVPALTNSPWSRPRMGFLAPKATGARPNTGSGAGLGIRSGLRLPYHSPVKVPSDGGRTFPGWNPHRLAGWVPARRSDCSSAGTASIASRAARVSAWPAQDSDGCQRLPCQPEQVGDARPHTRLTILWDPKAGVGGGQRGTPRPFS